MERCFGTYFPFVGRCCFLFSWPVFVVDVLRKHGGDLEKAVDELTATAACQDLTDHDEEVNPKEWSLLLLFFCNREDPRTCPGTSTGK